ncbi:NAD(+) diphosphatase [Luedemannella helvata]|uniref:NAD(+) diphosphatase n=1 Tax=Luedemannella helvata TaxID=349315 RepID=A0ABN2L4R0_9ACTN
MTTPDAARAARRPPPLARSALDRASHRRTDPAWLEAAWDRARILVVSDGRALAVDGHLVLFSSTELPVPTVAGTQSVALPERMFLGVDADGVPYFAVAQDLPAVPGAVVVGLREVGHELSDLDAGLLMTAVSLSNWHARHRFAPGSGALMESRDGGWVRVDPEGTHAWPRTDPAVIVIIHDGVAGPDGRCLLGHNAAWRASGVRRYSCLAGFVEPGESAEQAVTREVAEEVGTAVWDLRYEGSQAWPYPGSLMLGFSAVADSDAPLRLDPTEIADARWFRRADVRAVLDGATGYDFSVAPPSSIAHYLIADWAEA